MSLPSEKQLTNLVNDINYNNYIISKNNDKITNLNQNQLIDIIYLQTLKKYIYSIYSGDEINNLGLVIHNYNKIKPKVKFF